MPLRSEDSNKRVASNDFGTTRLKRVARLPMKRQRVFRFMDLPAELRNNIYAYCRTDKEEALIHNRRGSQQKNRRGQLRYFYALALVSQQVRREFLPMYAQSLSHRVSVLDFSAYIRALPASLEVVTGTITIDTTELGKANKVGINLAPLLRLCKRHHDLRLKIVDTNASDPHTITRGGLTYFLDGLQSLVVHTIATPTAPAAVRWSRNSDKAVMELWIVPTKTQTGRDFHARIVVKSSYDEWWMGWSRKHPEAYSKSTCTVIAEWVEKTGFHHLWMSRALQVCSSR